MVTMYARPRQTDKQTDRQTNIMAIARQTVAVLSMTIVHRTLIMKFFDHSFQKSEPEQDRQTDRQD